MACKSCSVFTTKSRAAALVISYIGFFLYIVCISVPALVTYTHNSVTFTVGLYFTCVGRGFTVNDCTTVMEKDTMYRISQIVGTTGLITYSVFAISATLIFFWTKHWNKLKGIKISAGISSLISGILISLTILTIIQSSTPSNSALSLSGYLGLVSVVIAILCSPFYIIDGLTTTKQMKKPRDRRQKRWDRTGPMPGSSLDPMPIIPNIAPENKFILDRCPTYVSRIEEDDRKPNSTLSTLIDEVLIDPMKTKKSVEEKKVSEMSENVAIIDEVCAMLPDVSEKSKKSGKFIAEPLNNRSSQQEIQEHDDKTLKKRKKKEKKHRKEESNQVDEKYVEVSQNLHEADEISPKHDKINVVDEVSEMSENLHAVGEIPTQSEQSNIDDQVVETKSKKEKKKKKKKHKKERRDDTEIHQVDEKSTIGEEVAMSENLQEGNDKSPMAEKVADLQTNVDSKEDETNAKTEKKKRKHKKEKKDRMYQSVTEMSENDEELSTKTDHSAPVEKEPSLLSEVAEILSKFEKAKEETLTVDQDDQKKPKKEKKKKHKNEKKIAKNEKDDNEPVKFESVAKTSPYLVDAAYESEKSFASHQRVHKSSKKKKHAKEKEELPHFFKEYTEQAESDGEPTTADLNFDYLLQEAAQVDQPVIEEKETPKHAEIHKSQARVVSAKFRKRSKTRKE